jgi:hypothetical protein
MAYVLGFTGYGTVQLVVASIRLIIGIENAKFAAQS